MLLEGSCHCGRVGFRVESPHPDPYNLCYCSICRKIAGGGGYAINLGAEFATLEVSGEDSVASYQPETDGKPNQSIRHFCRHCGSALWIHDERWPELVHPYASAIDTALPKPPERTHLMLSSKAEWVEPAIAAGDRQHDVYPDESLAEWHRRQGLAR